MSPQVALPRNVRGWTPLGAPHPMPRCGGQMRTAVLFPGQGSQTSDMRDTVARLRPDLYELALDEVGNELFERSDEKTEFAQPAIYCASLAGWSRYKGERPYAMAGHSLGEFAALAAAGAVRSDCRERQLSGAGRSLGAKRRAQPCRRAGKGRRDARPTPAHLGGFSHARYEPGRRKVQGRARASRLQEAEGARLLRRDSRVVRRLPAPSLSGNHPSRAMARDAPVA